MATSAVINLVLKAKDQASGVLTSAATKVTALVAAFAGAVAIKETVHSLTELDFAARRLGISMEDLTAAQYAAFSGANVQPDQLLDALDEVRIKVEEFSSIGSGGGVDFFEVMNADVEKFNKLNPLDQLEKISEALKGMSDNSAFTFLDQIGSDSLRNLLPILRDGGAEFKRLMEEAKRFNLVLSDTETIAVAKLGKSFAQLEKVGTTAFSKILADASPQLTALVQVVTESVVAMSREIEDSAKGIGSKFTEMLEGILGGLVFAGKIKNTFDVVFSFLGEGILSVSELFLLGLRTIDEGFVKAANGMVNVFRSAFSTTIGFFNTQFVRPIQDFADAFNLTGVSEKVKSFQKHVTDLQMSYGKPVEVFKSENFDVAIAGVKELRSKLHEVGKENFELLDTDADQKAADAFLARFKSQSIKNQEDLDRELANRKDKSDQKNIVKLQTKNAAASAQIAATQAKLQADLAHKEIEITISKIDTKRQVELSGLQERARLENLSAVQIADVKYRIEIEATKRLSEQKRRSLEVDIKALQSSLAGQQKLLAVTQNLNDRPGILATINQLEADITSKRADQATIGAELVNQAALLKAERAAELGVIKQQLQQIKDDAQIELLAIGGDQFSADIKKIEADFKDTIKNMESLGDDSTAIQKLISAKKAQAELQEIERQYATLKSRLEKHQISPLDYLDQANKLEERGAKAAEITGNPDDLDKVKDAAKAARAEVFDLGTLTDTVADSLQGGLEGLFTDFISGTKSAKEAFSDFARSVLTEVSKIIAKLLIQLAIQSMLNTYTGGASSGVSGLMSMIGMKHSGGLIGGAGGMSRYASMGLFAGAPRYHTGGEIGLKPNEVPIIALKGEEMLTESDPRHRKNLGKGGSSTSSSQPRISIHNVLDAPSLASAMEGAEGERMVMNHIRANRGEIKNL
ncbi:phage tail tape measure protein [Pseudomonas putida]|uniref:phage tail tape measure protein n=1 Tax=Pseudomonas putida TaxID=303 RepID=UPI00236487AD|nr:phage tail tape measure protein [Pseudomonas putida]MDD2005097.1 phage tail tape measure protein [Pseudomonas putida]